MSSVLDPHRISVRSEAAHRGLAIEVVASTGSTNADLRRRVGQLSGPLLLAAEVQTAGRGRAGRSWLAAAGDSLCFSLAWPMTVPVDRLAGLPLAIGVAVATTLRALGRPVQLKWPNDLMLDGAKLGGILVETVSVRAAPPAAQLWAVVGVGLNVHVNQSRDAGLGHPVAAIGAAVDRNALLASLADALEQALARFADQGLAPFIARWQSWHAHAGQPVVILEQGQVLHEGVAVGIDASGCLLLDTVSGRVAVAAGDVSLRRAAATTESLDAAAD